MVLPMPLPLEPTLREAHDRCVCGKIAYLSKRAARMANRSVGFRLREYQCALAKGRWHVSNSEKRGLLKRERPLE